MGEGSRLAPMDWAGSWFACSGHYTCAFPVNGKNIMSRYKPIAPKPIFVTSVQAESVPNSRSNNALNHQLRFGSERSNRKRRRASDFCSSPSPRGRRRTRAPCSPEYLGSRRGQIVQTVPASLIADRPKIQHPLYGCLGFVKDLGFVERGSNPWSVCDKESAVFGEEVKLNEVMHSMGNVVIQSPSKSMEILPIQAMRGDPECGLGFAKSLVVPSDVQKHHEEEKNWRNLVTLPLLPEASASKDSDMGSGASKSISNSNAPYDKEKFRLRIFGKDFSN